MDYPFKKEKIEKKIFRKNNLGMDLEKNLNLTNNFYKDKNIALIFKNAVPIQIVKVEYPKRQKAKIVEAYYRLNSLPDYQGIYKGKYLSFDAKETSNKNRFSLTNIPLHQINHLQNIKIYNGIAFFIIHFKNHQKYFYLPIDFLTNYLNHSKAKSINYQVFENNLFSIPFGYRPRIDYLKIVDKFIK